ncbi:MAG TPA: energy-coupling factor transporter ATPase [Syntrophothermus lipocalidus]|mgnify:CR=1 FL=1|nr:energy-coupling factor transporter ATPase [Syntrophothermus lipocalidus]
MLELNNVHFVYEAGQPPAVTGITFSVEPGDFVVILGRNGSGKSTLAKLMSGVIVPIRGTVQIMGLDTRERSHKRTIRRFVSLMLSDPENQIVSTLVEEDVAFGPENLGVPLEEIEHRVQEALASVGLTGYRNSSPRFLSGGEKQRLAIAGLLAIRTRYLVLDEPTAMLDARGRREVLAVLAQLNETEGIGVVMTSHRAEEMIWAKRVVILDEGQVRAIGYPKDIMGDEELLIASGIEPPPLSRLADALRRRGFQLPKPILTVEEMVKTLCQSV